MRAGTAENGVEWTSCDDGEIFHGSDKGGSDVPPIRSADEAWTWIEAQAKGHDMLVLWLRPAAGGRHQIIAANGTRRVWKMVPVDDGVVIAPEGSDLLL